MDLTFEIRSYNRPDGIEPSDRMILRSDAW